MLRRIISACAVFLFSTVAYAGEGRFEIAQFMLPYTVSNAGSYVVTENLTGTNGQNGIIIAANDVTIDLNGFQLIGVAGSLDGVAASGNRSNIQILNGMVRGWGDDGVDLNSASNVSVRDVMASLNTDDGIRVGDGSSVRDCTLVENSGAGLRAGEACSIQRVIARQNGGGGIVSSNACVITHCIARSNNGNGIWTGLGSTIVASTARGNDNVGIGGGKGTQISECVGYGNDVGIQIYDTGGQVVNSATYGNTDYGIQVTGAGSITFCAASANGLAGFVAGSNSYVFGNNAYENGTNSGSTGFLLTGTGNRLEQNHAGNATSGFTATTTNNLIVRNTATGHATNYAIAAGNLTGTITTNVATSNAWVNFSF